MPRIGAGQGQAAREPVEEAWELAVVSDVENTGEDIEAKSPQSGVPVVSDEEDASEANEELSHDGDGKEKLSNYVAFFLIGFGALFVSILDIASANSQILEDFVSRFIESFDPETLNNLSIIPLLSLGLLSVLWGFFHFLKSKTSSYDGQLKNPVTAGFVGKLGGFFQNRKAGPASRVFKQPLGIGSMFTPTPSKDWRDFLLTCRFRYLYEADVNGKASAIYLSVGILISVIAIATLFILALADFEQLGGNRQAPVEYFLPRFAFAILIQSFGFFFLRRHVFYEIQRQRCLDATTQIELRLSAGVLAIDQKEVSAFITVFSGDQINAAEGQHNMSSTSDQSFLLGLLASATGKKP